MKRSVVLVILFLGISNLISAQASPCPSGSLANVIGTSCTIGHLTFNFQNNFNGSIVIQDIFGNVQTIPFPASAIGFTPVQSEGHAGFILTPNFFDSTNGTGLIFSQHNATFSYTPQVNGAFEILGESSTLMGNIADVVPTSNDAVFAFDGQCFTNGLCMSVQPRIAHDPVNGPFNQPSVNASLGIPGLIGIGLGGEPFTNEVDSFAIGGGEAALTSILFLYDVAPQEPLPPPARLNYKNIDVPGEQQTIPETINAHGEIVGGVQDASGVLHAYQSDEDGSDLTIFDFPGAISTEAIGLNDRGDIVGQFFDTNVVSHGFLLQNGSFSTIDFPNAVFNVALQINNRGDIAGFYENADGSIHGYLFQNGQFTTIDDPNAPVFNGPNNTPITQTEIFSINDQGVLAGVSLDQNGFPQSFLLSHGDSDHFAVPASPGDTSVTAVNDELETVGSFVDINVITHGFLRDHGFRTVDFPGAVSTFPTDLDSNNKIVGFYTDNSGIFHGFLADKTNADDSSADPNALAQPVIENGSGVIQPKAAMPCMGRQPMHPDPKSGIMTCSSTR